MPYTKLAQQHREIAALLMATANEMAGYRNYRWLIMMRR
jgi:hypothetical protein